MAGCAAVGVHEKNVIESAYFFGLRKIWLKGESLFDPPPISTIVCQFNFPAFVLALPLPLTKFLQQHLGEDSIKGSGSKWKLIMKCQ